VLAVPFIIAFQGVYPFLSLDSLLHFLTVLFNFFLFCSSNDPRGDCCRCAGRVPSRKNIRFPWGISLSKNLFKTRSFSKIKFTRYHCRRKIILNIHSLMPLLICALQGFSVDYLSVLCPKPV